MRRVKLLAVLGLCLLAGACASTQERRAEDEGRCRSYGFRRGSDAFANCLLKVDLDRSADRRATLNTSYGGWGPGWYGRRGPYW